VAAEANNVNPRKVFVIHGRNEKARRGSSSFCARSSSTPSSGPRQPGSLGRGLPVVLQTPDDVAYLHETLAAVGDPDCSPQMQPRPNVLFEAGPAMGRDEDRTVIVEVGQIRLFSDIRRRPQRDAHGGKDVPPSTGRLHHHRPCCWREHDDLRLPPRPSELIRPQWPDSLGRDSAKLGSCGQDEVDWPIGVAGVMAQYGRDAGVSAQA